MGDDVKFRRETYRREYHEQTSSSPQQSNQGGKSGCLVFFLVLIPALTGGLYLLLC